MEMNDDSGTQRQVLVALRRIIRAVDLHSKYLAQRYGLTGPQLVLLKEIAHHQPISTGELAEKISLGQATVSSILDRMEKRGLVKRSRSGEDKRRVMNEVTDKATQILEQDPSLIQNRFVTEFGKLADWERSLLLSALQRVAQMMNAEALEASPVLISGPLDATVEETSDFFGREEQESS
jgi:DNA-binding MarR family transcriptional regulator